MINLRQPVRALMASAAILLVGIALTFSILAGTEGTTAPQPQAAASVAFPQQELTTAGSTPASKPKAIANLSATTSVLDAEVLNSPVAYLRQAFSAEDEDNTERFRSGTVMMTLKALAASLLSTII